MPVIQCRYHACVYPREVTMPLFQSPCECCYPMQFFSSLPFKENHKSAGLHMTANRMLLDAQHHRVSNSHR